MESSSTKIATLAIGSIGAAFFLAKLASWKKTGAIESDETDKPQPLPEAPPGSKFVELPESEVTLRYTDTAEINDPKSPTKKDGDQTMRTRNAYPDQVTFLLIHGFAGVLETWELLIPYLLESDARVVALDMVGSGFSDKPDDETFDYSYRSQGRVVSEFISVLGLSNVVLVGHSSGTVVGASTALQSAGNGKEVVVAVFVANALFRPKPAFFSKPWLKGFFRWTITKTMNDRKKSLEKMHLPVHAERVLTDAFVEKFAAPTRLPSFYDALVGTVMAKEPPYEDLLDGLLAVTPVVPMLFVHGKDDDYKPLPEQQKESMQQKLDAMDAKSREQLRLDVTELEECKHYAQHEQPENLAKEILGFVQKNVV